jgi:hypothetical protein
MVYNTIPIINNIIINRVITSLSNIDIYLK